MPATVVVGSQWGDEGKGKVVDLLTEQADIVVRFQGGNNAGHTVMFEDRTHVLHLIPSGIFRDNKLAVPGTSRRTAGATCGDCGTFNMGLRTRLRTLEIRPPIVNWTLRAGATAPLKMEYCRARNHRVPW